MSPRPRVPTSPRPRPTFRHSLYCINANCQQYYILPAEISASNLNCGPKLRFALWNARSINNKVSSICDLVIDICAVTETWLTGNDCFTLTNLINTLQDYNVYSLPRATRGGRVAVIARKGLQVKRNNSSVFSSFETLDLAITSGNKQFRLLTIYRPRATKKNKLSTPQFFSEFLKFP